MPLPDLTARTSCVTSAYSRADWLFELLVNPDSLDTPAQALTHCVELHIS